MKKSEFFAAVMAYQMELMAQDAKHSTGSVGKLAEVMARNLINKKGIKNANDVRCRTAGRADVRIGRSIIVEVKTGCGAVNYAQGELFTKESLTAENVLPHCDLVLWAPFLSQVCNAQTLTESILIKNTFVFTREQFINCLESIGKNGLASSLKISKGGYQINIQTISPKMEGKLWNILENMPTMQDVL